MKQKLNKMKLVKVMLGMVLIATGIAATAQNENPKLIAVVNKANWCAVCKANGERFGATIMPYTSKGVNVLMNDLTNKATIAASDSLLQYAGVYKTVYAAKRKGMGKMLQSCGLSKDRMNTSLPSGLVTFIDPKTHKQLKQVSIVISDAAMKKIIDNLLIK